MIFSPRLRLALIIALGVLLAGSAGATPAKRPVHGVPKILGVFISAREIRPGETVTGHVETTPNVSYVEARIENYNAALTRRANGKFTLDYTVPLYLAPMWWLKHEWTLQIIARSIDGVEVSKRMPVALK